MSKSKEEQVYLTTLSKLIFPQSVNTETNIYFFIKAKLNFKNDWKEVIEAIRQLSRIIAENDVNYFQLAKSLTITFPSVKIIFPFHTFW